MVACDKNGCVQVICRKIGVMSQHSEEKVGGK